MGRKARALIGDKKGSVHLVVYFYLYRKRGRKNYNVSQRTIFSLKLFKKKRKWNELDGVSICMFLLGATSLFLYDCVYRCCCPYGDGDDFSISTISSSPLSSVLSLSTLPIGFGW